MRSLDQSGDAPRAGSAGTAPVSTGPFMLTLSRLSAPIPIRQPRAPHLQSFTFFMSRSRQADGEERLYLHMGYFATRAEAQHWAQLMSRAYPSVVASPAPAALQHDGISLLRPDDTDTRRALKQAVVQGEPVLFAIQLQWSALPIDLTRVPSLSIFRAYTLYVAAGRRDGRAWYSLRLGFFRDAISAKQVAHYIRPDFASVAVVPIGEQERTRAKESHIDSSALARTAQQGSHGETGVRHLNVAVPKRTSRRS